MKTSEMRALVAVGSRRDRVCSVGAFARAEAEALSAAFRDVEVLDPTASDQYPVVKNVRAPDVIFYHAPSLCDRGKPFSSIKNAFKLRAAFPKARFISIVHEYSEAPLHWRVRQLAILRLSHAAIVNSKADYDGVSRWHSRVLRSRLGPTLFSEELLSGDSTSALSAALKSLRGFARERVVAIFSESHALSGRERWLLHPGLLVPGKGINFLSKLAPVLSENTRLIIMGGIGPKESDREFAERTLAELREKMKGRLSFIDSPSDEVFKDFLLASDLVVLPYDAGLSERRSSFLSAMCCGSNVWTTIGRFSWPLELDRTGAHLIQAESWISDDPLSLRSVADALTEPDEAAFARRIKNLGWASERTWASRIESISRFISTIDE